MALAQIPSPTSASRDPRDGETLRVWRDAIERAARAHRTCVGLPPGPRRSRLEEQLRNFTQERARVAREAQGAIRSEADFEAIAGTTDLVTCPDLPSRAVAASTPQLGFPWAIILGLGVAAGSVWGVYYLSKQITDWATEALERMFWISVAGVGVYLGWKFFIAPGGERPRSKLGESMA